MTGSNHGLGAHQLDSLLRVRSQALKCFSFEGALLPPQHKEVPALTLAPFKLKHFKD